MKRPKSPTTADMQAFLKRHGCQIPFHAVRARFMGGIASPAPNISPLHAIQSLWDGGLPDCADEEDLNRLLNILVNDLWNPLTSHNDRTDPFHLTSVKEGSTRRSVLSFALVRRQEVEGFIDGLFGSYPELQFPDAAYNAVDVLRQILSMLAGIVTLLEDKTKPATPRDLAALLGNLQSLTAILEAEMNTVILSCAEQRKQALLKQQSVKPTVH